jgi:hypothetical protein
MTRRKRTDKAQPGAPSKGTDLLEHITAIITDESTPAELHNAVVDSVCELAWRANVSLLTPEVLRVAWPLMLRPRPQERAAGSAPQGAGPSQTLRD